MVDRCHLQVTMGPGTALNLNTVFIGEWLHCRTTRCRNTNCLRHLLFISTTLKLLHSVYLISGYGTHTSNVCAGPPGTFGTLPMSFDGAVGIFSGRSLLLHAAPDCDLLLGALPPFHAGCPKRPTYVWTTALGN